MSKRLPALLMGIILMPMGIGLFLWDWYGEYIHFFWFIPFFILGPIVFVCGLIMVLKALFPGKKSFKETMPPLARMEKREDVEGLIKALRHKEKDVRMSAAEALGEIGDVRAMEPLVQALKDEDKDVRMNAAWALGRIGDARAVEPLIQASKDEVRDVRRLATEALDRLGIGKESFKESEEKVRRYYNDKYGFSIEPPSGWTVDKGARVLEKSELDAVTLEQLKRSTVVAFLGPREEYLYRPVITITIAHMPGAWTLEEWVSGFKQFCTKTFTDFQLLSEGSRVIGGIDAYEEAHFYRSLFDGYLLYQKQVVFPKDSEVYSVVYSASLTNYDKYLHCFEASVETFKFKQKPR